MKKALAAALLAALALTGCAQAAPAAPVHPKVAVDVAVQPKLAVDATIYEAVERGWDGTAPDHAWIENAATVVCKQIIGGIEPRVVPDHAANNEVMVAAAEQYVCEVDR